MSLLGHGMVREESINGIAILLAVYDEAAENFQSLVRVMSGFSDEMYAKLKEQLKPGEVNAKPDDVNTKERIACVVRPRVSPGMGNQGS